jgi:hypothetical protein
MSRTRLGADSVLYGRAALDVRRRQEWPPEPVMSHLWGSRVAVATPFIDDAFDLLTTR